MKKQTKKIQEDVYCCQKSSFLGTAGRVVLAVVLIGGFFKFGIVARVNGTPIYRWDYIAKLEKADTAILDGMIQEALIMGEAKNKKVAIDQKEIDEQLVKIEAQIKEQGTTLEEAIKSEGLTKEDIISQIKIQKIAEKLASPSAVVTQAQIDEYLKTNKAYLPTGKSKDELQTLARTQLETQAKNTALSTWYNDLKSAAKIEYQK